MDNKLTFSLIILALSVVSVNGCAKVSEPWDKTGYFKEERTRSAEQRQALQHRLAYFKEAESDQPWTHAQQ